MIGRDRHGKPCKKSVYMGKEEVRERNWLIYKLVYRLIESVQGNRKYREGLVRR
jgi:hypothetical protein